MSWPTPHPECIEAALAAAGADRDTRASYARHVYDSVARELCSRCGAGLGHFVARSRATEDRCVPVCGECGAHESMTEWAGRPVPTSDWPLDPSEVRAQAQTVKRQLER